MGSQNYSKLYSRLEIQNNPADYTNLQKGGSQLILNNTWAKKRTLTFHSLGIQTPP